MAYRQRAFVPIKKIPNIKNNSFLNCKINIKWYNIKDNLPHISDKSREYHFYRLWKLKKDKEEKQYSYDSTMTTTANYQHILIYREVNDYGTTSVQTNNKYDTSTNFGKYYIRIKNCVIYGTK